MITGPGVDAVNNYADGLSEQPQPGEGSSILEQLIANGGDLLGGLGDIIGQIKGNPQTTYNGTGAPAPQQAKDYTMLVVLAIVMVALVIMAIVIFKKRK